MTNAVDLDTKTRVQNNVVDMGCYEYILTGPQGTRLIFR